MVTLGGVLSSLNVRSMIFLPEYHHVDYPAERDEILEQCVSWYASNLFLTKIVNHSSLVQSKSRLQKTPLSKFKITDVTVRLGVLSLARQYFIMPACSILWQRNTRTV